MHKASTVRVNQPGDQHYPGRRIGVMHTKPEAGFTLVELLVVIVIIAALAAIILPVYATFDRNHKQNVCINNLRAIGVALAQYRDDREGEEASVRRYPVGAPAAYLMSRGLDAAEMPYTALPGRSFSGSGIDDLEVVSNGTSPVPTKYEVKIADIADPLLPGSIDTYVWRMNDAASWTNAAPLPLVAEALINGVEIRFGADIGHAATDTWTFYTGIDNATANQFGLATLYYQYLDDEKDYVTSYRLFHCPAQEETERLDRRRNIEAYPALRDFRRFDPLWAGYNTYDVTYNFNQYEGDIAAFDQHLGQPGLNAPRQLSKPNPPADTVVTWCYGHRRSPQPSYTTPADDQGVQGSADFRRRAMDARRSERDLVLWLDGTVDTVRPYLAQNVQTGDWYWVPPFLYSPGEGQR